MKGGQSLTELSVPIGLLLAERAVASLNKNIVDWVKVAAN